MPHLFTILPATCLVVLQFVPIVRYKVILFHRLHGYVVVMLSLMSSAGVIGTTIVYLLAYVNIELRQIDQHRAWILRAWAY
ncbi:hypothetical protein LTR56_027508, partial [Elasticomyces elasticus]